jgi:predicted nucleic acid-binding protein
MTEQIIVNTGPLIALGKMQAFASIARLPFVFLCPAEVEAEISAGVRQGYDVEIPSFIQIVSLKNPLSLLSVAVLDAGEAAVIQLALENNIARVCIDELKGRRAALAVGLTVIGSLGLIGRAKTLGIISKVKPFIEQARNAGIYYDHNLIEVFLKSLGE